MSEKIITWAANLVLACVLVLVAVYNPVFAQEQTQTDDTAVTDDSGSGSPVEEEPGKIKIPLTGTAVIQIVGNLQVTPAVFNTGLIDIGESTTTTVILNHEGGADSDPVQIQGVSLFGAQKDEFTTDFSGFQAMYPGESIEVAITFTPMIPGKKSAGLKLDVEGATAPHVIMVEGSARYPLTSNLEAKQTDAAFGQVIINQTSSQQITVVNNSEEADAPQINLFAANLSGDTPDAFVSGFNATTLAPGEEYTFKVDMLSPGEGRKDAVLTIEHDGFNGPVEILLGGDVIEPKAIPVNFTTSKLKGANIQRGTSIQFGPDGKLYVAQMDGKINVYSVTRNGKNNYTANKDETINSIATTKNHDDDGDVNNGLNERLVTAILVAGTAAKPVIYVPSSDPRQGGGPSGVDLNLDTNSGILHRLTKNGNGWIKDDLVRGLPRSEENHASNGMVLMGNTLLMSQGGHTNQGAPSNNFAEVAEYALSAAVLEFDLAALGDGTYDLPTLDDEDRAGANDNNDPFGGNNGKNQAILVKNGPVGIYATGFRNAYDLVLTNAGNLYTIDNGPNAGWGGEPAGNCTNKIDDGGLTFNDNLHHIKNKGYYGGHPNPTRGNKGNTFNASNPQSPVQIAANGEECDYKKPGGGDGALTTFGTSTNGFTEYTATNFGAAMTGDLIAASFGKTIYRIQLNDAGTKVTSKSTLLGGQGAVPLDVTAQGNNDVFPGTIWIVDNQSPDILVMEPADY